MKKIIYITGSMLLVACSTFLDEKPERSLAIPNTLEHLQAILDNETRNGAFPSSGDMASDFYYLDDAAWNSMNEATRSIYAWSPDVPPPINDWYQSYQRIFDANVILDRISEVEEFVRQEDVDRIKGEALFLRGWTFYQLAQIFSPPYSESTSGLPYGIPIRLSADINQKTTRSNVGETYQRIIDDLQGAVNLLPDMPMVKTRPGKAAAYAVLCRTFMAMREYEKAETYADSCLRIYNTLMDYNDLNIGVPNPFESLNEEVIYHASFFPLSLFNYMARVDTTLYHSYQESDLRKSMFYQENAGGIMGFYGDYSGGVNGPSFCGIATDEMVLSRAECRIRTNKVAAGIEDLNRLLIHRFEQGTFQDITVTDRSKALALIVHEREKQLAFRGGIRWMDLRRLNWEQAFAKQLTRTIGGKDYILEPNDKRYVFLIPFEVVEMTGIEQNER